MCTMCQILNKSVINVIALPTQIKIIITNGDCYRSMDCNTQDGNLLNVKTDFYMDFGGLIKMTSASLYYSCSITNRL